MTDRSPHPLAGLLLRQHDGVTCGPTVAVVSGGLLDPARLAAWADPTGSPTSSGGCTAG